MGKISVRFESETEKIIRERAAKKEITPSEYIRNLVEIGLKLKEYSTEKNQIKQIKNQLKKC